MKLLRIRLLVMFGVLSVSFAAILVKMSEATSLSIAFYRMFFSMLFTAPFIMKDISLLRKISRNHYFWMSLSGLAIGLHFYVWFISLNHTSIANSMVFICMSPIFTVIGDALIFKARFSRKELLMIGVAMSGGVIMALHKGFDVSGEIFGNAMALLGSFFIGVYFLIGRFVRKDVETFPYTFVVYGFASLFLGVIAFLSHNELAGYGVRDWVIFILLAIVPTLLGHNLFSFALRYVKAAFISTAVLFEPVLTVILAVFIFREYPDLLQIIGGSVILLTLILYTKYPGDGQANGKGQSRS